MLPKGRHRDTRGTSCLFCRDKGPGFQIGKSIMEVTTTPRVMQRSSAVLSLTTKTRPFGPHRIAKVWIQPIREARNACGDFVKVHLLLPAIALYDKHSHSVKALEQVCQACVQPQTSTQGGKFADRHFFWASSCPLCSACCHPVSSPRVAWGPMLGHSTDFARADPLAEATHRSSVQVIGSLP